MQNEKQQKAMPFLQMVICSGNLKHPSLIKKQRISYVPFMEIKKDMERERPMDRLLMWRCWIWKNRSSHPCGI